MAEKASAAAEKASEAAAANEGSGIFESLFGGFSNGLSIFTNNPFRRKNATASALEEEEASDDESGSEMSESDEEADGIEKKTTKEATSKVESEGDSLAEDMGTDLTSTALEEDNPESSLKKIKRMDEDVVVEKKRRKTEFIIDLCVAEEDDVNIGSGGGESRKRKPEPGVDMDATTAAEEVAAGVDDHTGAEAKKKLKKKIAGGLPESEQLPEEGLKQSTRNKSKKRLNEDLLFSLGIPLKERRLEKTSAIIEEPDSEENGVKVTGKRGPEDADGDEKVEKVKKTKRLVDLDSDGLIATKVVDEQQVGGPPIPMETRSGSKRKKDINVEELYERKRRETVDEESNAKAQGNVEQGDLSERLRGKRKSSVEEEREEAMNAAKKKKPTKEERLDNEERLKRTIFVGNLPVSVKPKHLAREFSQFGAVESARLRSVPLVDTKLSRKAAVITGQLNESRSSLNGYVVFYKEESARAALSHNMTVFNGKHIRVDMATPVRQGGDKPSSSGIEYDRSRSIFVGNLPFDVEDEEVYKLFQGKTPDTEVEAVRVVRDPQTSAGKGFAFVCFKQKIGATTALDNAEFTKLRNRQLRIIRFGFQRRQTDGNLSGRKSSESYKSKPRPGAEERMSKRGDSSSKKPSYEGTRAGKLGKRPGKSSGLSRTTNKGKSNEKGSSSKASKAEKDKAKGKRPAVAARKMVLQGNAAAMVPAGGKRQKEEEGKKKKGKKGFKK